MAEKAISLLDEQLDEASQKYIQESLEAWKESVTNQLVEQMEQQKQAKIEELEEENAAYREQLKEEFTEKMLDGLNELKESIRAEVTAEVIKNNPELKIFEQVKEIVAPLVSENYRDNAYEDTITKLSEEVETLRRENELNEGAKTLAALVAPYSEKAQKLAISLIKEGSPEEVTEQFYELFDKLSALFEEDSSEDDSDDSEDYSDDSDDSEDYSEDYSEDGSDDLDEEHREESYIVEGYNGYEEKETPKENPYSMKNLLKSYANI